LVDNTEKQTTEIINYLSDLSLLLSGFQKSNGGFTRYHFDTIHDDWVTLYAGLFFAQITEFTEITGYENLIDNWSQIIRKQLENSVSHNEIHENQMLALRLLTLTMNNKFQLHHKSLVKQLLETDDLLTNAFLAAALALLNENKTADELSEKLVLSEQLFQDRLFLNSEILSKSLQLMAFCHINEGAKAFSLVMDISKILSEAPYLQNHELGFSAAVLAGYYQKYLEPEEMKFGYRINNGKEIMVSSKKYIKQVDIPMIFTISKFLDLNNYNRGLLHANLFLKGKPLQNKRKDTYSNMGMLQRFMDLSGKSLDVGKLANGTDFIMEIEVIHPDRKSDYEDLVLYFAIPTGWELYPTMDKELFQYCIIEDGMFIAYFNLEKGVKKIFRFVLGAKYPGDFLLSGLECRSISSGEIYVKLMDKRIHVNQLE